MTPEPISSEPGPTKNREWYMGAVISSCGLYRYQLWRRWSDGFPILPWIMLNPSTADGSQDDATIRRCVNFARSWGFGGIEVYNLFAYRATNPRSLFEAKDAIGPDNGKFLSGIRQEKIVAAWGAFPKYLGNRDRDVLLKLQDDHTIWCLGMTAEGYPRHPVRLAADTKLEPYLKVKDLS